MKFFGALWGILGVTLLIGSAVFRLSQRVIEAFDYEISLAQGVFAAAWLIFMVVGEGYRGFQKKFSPRVAARARYLYKNPKPLHVLLAPFFCMGFFHATRRRMIASWILTTMIVLLVLLVSQLPQPWRGIVDLGVVAGLGWGLVSLWVFCLKALFTQSFTVDPEVPKQS